MIACAADEKEGVQKSAAALARDLLRSLSDAAAIAQNELVAPIMASGDREAQYARARTGVLQALESLRPDSSTFAATALHQNREYEILVRYDLQGQSIDDVMRTLWIEKSQFYRERSHALERLAERIADWVRAQSVQSTFSSEEYRVATALQRSGNSALARAMLERLARSSSGTDKGRCLLRIAELHVDGGDVARANEFVACALAQSDPSDDQTPLLDFDAKIVEAQIAWAAGASDRALEILMPAIAGVRRIAGECGDQARALLGKALALKATIAFHTSTLDECARLVGEGCALLDERDERTAETFAELLTIRTSIHTARVSTLEDARVYDDALMTFAKERGLVRKLAVGLKDLAVISHYSGNRSQAQIYADQALALSTAVCGSKERAVATFEWAHMRIESGDVAVLPEVRIAVAQTRKGLAAGGFWWAYSFAIDGYALLAQNQPAQALAEADVALSCFQTIRSARGVGIARALQARALRMLGDVRESAVRLEQALEHLQRAPQGFWLPYAEQLLANAS